MPKQQNSRGHKEILFNSCEIDKFLPLDTSPLEGYKLLAACSILVAKGVQGKELFYLRECFISAYSSHEWSPYTPLVMFDCVYIYERSSIEVRHLFEHREASAQIL